MGVFVIFQFKFLVKKRTTTFVVIFIFILLCELFVVLKNKEMKGNFVYGFSTFYFEVQILVL
jgi:ABC-type transport system involved in multi-copper enzyme maturation permease subunit